MAVRGPQSWPLAWTTAGTIVIVFLAAAICSWVGMETAGVVSGAGVVALLGVVLVVWHVTARNQALKGLEKTAEQMLAANLSSTLGAHPPARQTDIEDIPEELRPLHRALVGLSERMRVQLREVAKKSRNLEALIDAMDEPLLVTDSDDRVILCSRSAEAILDSAPGGLLGRPIRDLFTNAQILEMHGAAKAGQVRRERTKVVTPLGQRAFQISGSPVPAAWGVGVFGAVITLRDVTELDQAVQVKSDFVANASHELRTPVAAIRSAAETLEAAADDPHMSARLRGMIVSHAERLDEMLRDLLDLSRLESPDLPLAVEPVDLREIERTLRTLSEHAAAERRLELSFEFDDDLIGFRTDRKLLTLILRNLVENATKFAHEGTTVRILGRLVEEDVPVGADGAAAPARARRGVVRFEVIDKGVGIPLAQQDRVFERYYQVDPARTGTGSAPIAVPGSGTTGSWRRGTGLGLAIVKHAAKALGGRAGLTSVWGQGTTVFVEFPCELGG